MAESRSSEKEQKDVDAHECDFAGEDGKREYDDCDEKESFLLVVAVIASEL